MLMDNKNKSDIWGFGFQEAMSNVFLTPATMKNIPIIFALCLLFSCSKKDDLAVPSLQTVTISGYQVRDELGNIAGDVGFPDIRIGNVTNYYSTENDFFFISFPNPSTSHVLVSVQSKSHAIAKLWMVKASLSTSAQTEQSVQMLGANQFVSGGNTVFEIDSLPVFSSHSLFSLNYENVPNGYYRLYLQMDNILLWDNIVVSK